MKKFAVSIANTARFRQEASSAKMRSLSTLRPLEEKTSGARSSRERRGKVKKEEYRKRVKKLTDEWLKRKSPPARAIAEIQRYCENTNCRQCFFAYRYPDDERYQACLLQHVTPGNWKFVMAFVEEKE